MRILRAKKKAAHFIVWCHFVTCEGATANNYFAYSAKISNLLPFRAKNISFYKENILEMKLNKYVQHAYVCTCTNMCTWMFIVYVYKCPFFFFLCNFFPLHTFVSFLNPPSLFLAHCVCTVYSRTCWRIWPYTLDSMLECSMILTSHA